jgi:peptidoglycan hydrolase-like protein with peptidoglycan-binding domain/3D (Asp-Asp-Asp) domain-containing protein
MKIYKHIFFLTFLLILGLFYQVNVLASSVKINEEKTFVVSAYYSPIEGQDSYVWGSYEADKRMNGNGIRAADFTKVYVGMIAAPKSYPFGTKIYIEGLGVGTVHDRGGAIKKWKNADRLDIWMGWGDDGRKRAMQWGMKTLKGKVVSRSTKNSFNFLANKISVKSTSNYLYIGDRGEKVIALQNFLYKNNFLKRKPTGYYGQETYEAVFLFQRQSGILQNKSDMGAGRFGPQTYKMAKKLWSEKNLYKEVIYTKKVNIVKEKIQSKNIDLLNYSIIKPNLQKGDRGEEIKRLQLVLQGLGYFKESNNYSTYDESTVIAVFNYQKDNNIVLKKTDIGAGRFGPKTYNSMITKLIEKRKGRKNNFIASKDSITESQLAMRRININIAQYNVDFGDKNDEVKLLQNELILRGFLDENLNTGFYGNKTKEALKSYNNFLS